MSEQHHVQEVPRGALIGALALILTSLAVASTGRTANLATQAAAAPAPPPLESFDARFEDAADGSILVLDAKDGHQVAVIAPGAENFVRGVLRGMFRSRKLESIGHAPPFTLAREADGRLTLTDKQTARTIDLESFGPTNTGAFARLLAAGVARP
jgi:putative photosynthetic complex assembly protein